MAGSCHGQRQATRTVFDGEKTRREAERKGSSDRWQHPGTASICAVTLKFNAKLKSAFFDRPKVRKKIGEANAKAFMRIGGKLRVSGQRNIRKRKKTSKPGQGPTAWLSGQSQNAHLRKIVFALHPSGWGLVVGPILFSGQQKPPATRLLEHGGEVRQHAVWRVHFLDGTTHLYFRFPHHLTGNTNVKKIDPPEAAGKKGRGDKIRMKYRPRPFMAPALEKNLKHIPEQWRGSFR